MIQAPAAFAPHGAGRVVIYTSLVNWAAFALIATGWWGAPPRWRVAWLAGSSLALLFFNDWLAGLALLATGAAALAGPRWARRGGGLRAAAVYAAVLLPLLLFKYPHAFGLPGTGWSVGPVFDAATIVIPLGISYFTFKALMCARAGLRGELESTRLSAATAYLAFAPAASAGPIDRLHPLLAQLMAPRRLSGDDLLYAGYRIASGVILKFLLADTLQFVVLSEFQPASLAGSPVRLLAFGPLFSLLIYFDFAGYSAIAIGCAALLGIRSMENFDRPYLKPDIGAFWRAWHISLTTFLRDDLFLPLAMRWSRLLGPTAAAHAATLVTFSICGLWHGEGLNFLLWGLYHGGLISAHQAFHAATRHARPIAAWRRTRWYRLLATALTFAAVSAGWFLFAFDLEDLGTMIGARR